MKRNYFISVALATYNGEKYIKDQLFSILNQLEDNDEIVISDDGSTDKTILYIKEINDTRIRIIQGPRKGVKQNFSNAIENCNGKYIFLSDQDDIWCNNKVLTVLESFNRDNVSLVLHDAEIVNENLESYEMSFFDFRKSKKGIIKNIYKNSFIGCCMAFDARFKNKILPIPNNIYMHDQWIGIICETIGEVVLIPEKLILYRRHANNVSQLSRDPFYLIVKKRMVFILFFMRRYLKIRINQYDGRYQK